MSDTFKYLRYRLRHALPHGNAVKFFLTVLLVLALPAGVILTHQIQKSQAGAALDAISVSVSPSRQTIPPTSNFKIIADTKTNQIAFVRLEFTIDPSKVNLTSEITVTPALATLIEKTSMAEVNSSGTGVIVAALTPTDRANPITGQIELANFNIHTVSSDAQGDTPLSITDSGIQFINMESQSVPFTSSSAILSLNTFVPTAAETLVPTETVVTQETQAPLEPKTGDANGDGIVNITDIGIISDAYGTQPVSDTRADINADGKVTIIDIGLVVDNYGK